MKSCDWPHEVKQRDSYVFHFFKHKTAVQQNHKEIALLLASFRLVGKPLLSSYSSSILVFFPPPSLCFSYMLASCSLLVACSIPLSSLTLMKRGKRRETPRSPRRACAAGYTGERVKSAPRISQTSCGMNQTEGLRSLRE